MKRLALLILTGVAWLGFGASAAHAAPANTFVDLESVQYEGLTDETVFRGDITSNRRKCLDDRKVLVFRKRSGKDDKIGRTEANEDKPGEFGWSLVKPGGAKGGVYYAKAPAIDGCNAGRSDGFKYVAARAQRAAKGDTLLYFEDINYTLMANEALYRGKVFSDQLNCLNARKVTVFRKRSGKDDKIGTTETFTAEPGVYEWSLLRFKEPKEGFYYAKTPTLTKCTGDKSNLHQYVG